MISRRAKITINNINEDLLKFIYKTKNASYSAKYSYNKKKNSYTNHKKWILNKLKKKNSLNIITVKKKYAGYLFLIKKYNKDFLSWAIEKKYQGKKIGKNNLKNFLIGKQKIFAKIHYQNIGSIKVAKYAGLKPMQTKGPFILFRK
jgi:hypothetical protein